MPFRRQDITTERRIKLGCYCVLQAGRYGLMSELADEYGVSRQFLYRLRDRARAALEEEVGPRRVGRPRRAGRAGPGLDRRVLERAVLTLHQVAHASVRGIRACLQEVLGVRRSVGWVQGVVAGAARRARAVVPVPARAVEADADEAYAGRRPVLEVVDRPSGLVLALEPASSADETAWGCVLLDPSAGSGQALAERGVRVVHLGADGATGLAAGARAAGLGAPRQDHWHALRDPSAGSGQALGRAARALESEAFRRLAAADRTARAAAAERYAAEHGRRPQRGRPLKVAADPRAVAATAEAAEAAIARADGVACVVGWVREALRPVEAQSGRVRTAGEVLGELGAAAALLRELGGRAVPGAVVLEHRGPGLVAYLSHLAAVLAGPRAAVGDETVTFLAWAWWHRHTLGLAEAAEAWPADPAAARAVWAALEGAARGTGMVENLNSGLTIERAARRGLPAPALALFAVCRNHHRFERGKRAGHTPLELAGLPSPDWLDALGYHSIPPPTLPTIAPELPETVTILAA